LINRRALPEVTKSWNAKRSSNYLLVLRGRKAARGIKTMILEKYHSVFELNEEERK
jgi:hypothetical protein